MTCFRLPAVLAAAALLFVQVPAQAQVAYWDARERMAACLAAPFAGSEAEATLDPALRAESPVRLGERLALRD